MRRFYQFFIILFCLNQFVVADSFKDEVGLSVKELNERGIELAREKRYTEALKKFKYLEYTDKISGILYNNLGYTYQLKGDYQKAIEHYKKSVKMNPQLVSSQQNLGELLFKLGNYKEAIKYGENVLKIDSNNVKVKKWLPTAYQKYNEGYAHNILLKAGWEKVRVDYFVQNIFTIEGKKFQYYFHPIGFGLPMRFNLEIRTYFQIKLKLNSIAFTGILNPAIVSGEEIIEVGYSFKKVYFGFGVMLTQINFKNDSIPFSDSKIRTIKTIDKATDYKLGVSFIYESYDYDLMISIFPRYLFRDSSSGSYGISFDRNFIDLTYILKTHWNWGFFTPRIISTFVMNEWYITEYQSSRDKPLLGHYFGYYDFTVGLIFGKRPHQKSFSSVEVGFRSTARMYFLDINDTNPFAFGNGQGFFGLTIEEQNFKGRLNDGLRSYALRLEIFSKQSVYHYFIFKESLVYEFMLTPPKNVSSLALNIEISYSI